MISHGEEHRGIVDQKVIGAILSQIPKDHLNDTTRKVSHPPPIPGSPNLLAANSPKPRSKHRLQKIMTKRTSKSSTTEAPNVDVLDQVAMGGDDGATQMSAFEECKAELMKRLLAFVEEEEEVMVISMGYPSIDCPGMLSEDKVSC